MAFDGRSCLVAVPDRPIRAPIRHRVETEDRPSRRAPDDASRGHPPRLARPAVERIARDGLVLLGLAACGIAAAQAHRVHEVATGPTSRLSLAAFCWSTALALHRTGPGCTSALAAACLTLGAAAHALDGGARWWHGSPFAPDGFGWQLGPAGPAAIPLAAFVVATVAREVTRAVAGPRGSRRTAIACGGLLAAWLACTAGSRLVAGTGLQCGILSAQRPTAPAPGDHIVVPRGIYAHHGIYCGEGQVASYIWQPGGVRFVMTPMIQYARGGPVAVRSYAACRPTAEVLAGVRQHLGEHRYSGVLRNCEHLATLCKTGRAESWQIEAVVSAVLAGILLGSASARWPRATDGVRD